MEHSEMEKRDAVDEILDRGATQIRESEPDPVVVSQAANRVWAQLAGKHNARRGMKIVRENDPVLDFSDDDSDVIDIASRRPSRTRLWALAAILLATIGVAQFLVREFWPHGPSATVKTVDGQLFRVTETAQIPLEIGTEIQEGDVIRTSREGGAVVRLMDGSLVELSPRSEMSIDEGRKGTTLDLGHGNIIVEAAKQRNRHLFVATDDCLVSVVGTIFSVNHGTKGSRVSVIEGEVKVDHGGDHNVLLPGEQVTTHRLLAPLKVADEIAWSQNADSYIKILRQYSDLRRELDLRVSRELRYSSDLLELMPEDTVLYAAAPNVANTVTQTHQVLQERMAQSPELAEWWAAEAAGDFQEHVDEVVVAFEQLGSYLGDELAVGGYLENDEVGGVVALAEVTDTDGLRRFIEDKLAEIAGEHPDSDIDGPIFVEDPRTVGDQSENLYIWFYEGGKAVASNSAARLQQVATLLLDGGDNPFVGTPFYQSIAALYDEGTEYIVAVDFENVFDNMIARTGSDDGEADGEVSVKLAQLGIDNAQHLLLEQKTLDSVSHHRAVATFQEARSGIASWLAAPAPMAGLAFVSPDAKLVAGVVFKDPAAMLDDIFSIAGTVPEELREAEQRYGLSIRDDFAASIGGELVFALDGPLLPTPSWKAIIEVYDPARLQWAFEQALAEVNTHLAEQGEKALVLEQTEMNGRTLYTLPSKITDVHYTFFEGYMLMAPNRALLDQAIRYKQSGYSITKSAKFGALLPQDGRNNFSALVYQDLSSVMQGVAEKLANGNLTEEQQAALESLKGDAKPMLGYAYGEEKRIVLAAGSDGDVLTSLLLRAMGLKNPAGLEMLFADLIDGHS